MSIIGDVIILIILPLTFCHSTLDFSATCGKCILQQCPFKVGLLAEFSTIEATAVEKAATIIVSAADLQTKWSINLVNLDQRESKQLSNPTNHELMSVVVDEVISNNVSVVIGPESNVAVERVHPLLAIMNVTHIAPLASNPAFRDSKRFANLIRLVPDDKYQLQAAISVVKFFRYVDISVFTSFDEYGLSIVEAVRRDYYRTKTYNLRVIRMIQSSSIKVELQKTFKELKRFKPHMIILALTRSQKVTLLTEAYKANLTTAHDWMWLALNSVSNLPLEKIIFKGQSHQFKELLGLRPRLNTDQVNAGLGLTSSDVSFTAQRYIDSLLLVADRIKESCVAARMKKRKNGQPFSGRNNSESFLVPFFHHRNSKDPVYYDVLQAFDSNWSVIGQWALNTSIIHGQLHMLNGTKAIRPANRIRVTTYLDSPFVYFDNKSETDLSKLKGYGIDFLKELSRLDGFEYELHFVKDNQFGGINKTTGQWTGMIGEVERGEADMALATMTLTSERAQAVKFLPSFMRLELKFLILRSFNTSYTYNPFSFLNPFDGSFYAAMLIAVFLLAIALTTLSATSPYGTRGKLFLSHRAVKAKVLSAAEETENFSQLSRRDRQLLQEREEAKTGMGFNNSFYFVWSALFYQSTERSPQSFSGKIISLTWFFASTVFISYYTANVVTSVSLYAKKIDVVHSAEDLLLQPTIGFGTFVGSAVETQLKESNTNIARQMYRTINSGKSALHHMVSSVEEALALVNQGKYAIIIDSIVVDFLAVESNCRFKAVSLGFGSIEYALPVQKSFPFYESLSRHIADLKASGFFETLWQKYYHDLAACDHLDRSDNPLRSLTYTDLAGVFYLIAFGVATSFIVLAIEWIVASFFDVASSKPNTPGTLKEALRVRKDKLLHDMRWEWFPIEKYIRKWKKLRLPTQGVATEILTKHFVSSQRRHRPSGRIRPSRSLSSLDSNNASSQETSYTGKSRLSSVVKSNFFVKRRLTRASIRRSIPRRKIHPQRVSFSNS